MSFDMTLGELTPEELRRKPKRLLYAIAWNKKIRTPTGFTWVPGGIDYTHCDTVADARASTFHAHPNLCIHIVAAAPAVAERVWDDNGDARTID
jgi:hypothetical protein